MAETELKQGTITKLEDVHLESWLEAFLNDRKAQNFSPGTLHFYRSKLAHFAQFCEGRAITQVHQVSADELRRFLLWLADTHHNPGGVNACYRAVKAFLRWHWEENDLPGKPPISKVKPPKVPQEALEPVQLADVGKLLEACKGKQLLDLRDRAIFLTLLDTGSRAAELLALDLEDLDLVSGALLIRQGKGRKPRTVYASQDTRKALRAYVKARGDNCAALWVTDGATRLTYFGLRSMVARRSKQAGIEAPELHAFRRAFALIMLRSGVDVYSLQSLMGHADLQVLRRYLKQEDSDLQAAHVKGSPVDRLKGR
jgi:integrase/recombinase XerD